MREETKQLEAQEGKIIDFIDGKARPDNELEHIRQDFERTLIEEYQFDKADVGVDVRLKVPDGSKTVTRKLSLAVYRDGVKGQTQDDISILIQIAKPAVQPTDTKNGANELERALIACRTAQFACWTNGVEAIYFQKKKGKFDTDVLPVNDFPRKGEDASSIFTTDRSRLRVGLRRRCLGRRIPACNAHSEQDQCGTRL